MIFETTVQSQPFLFSQENTRCRYNDALNLTMALHGKKTVQSWVICASGIKGNVLQRYGSSEALGDGKEGEEHAPSMSD